MEAEQLQTPSIVKDDGIIHCTCDGCKFGHSMISFAGITLHVKDPSTGFMRIQMSERSFFFISFLFGGFLSLPFLYLIDKM